MVSENLWRCSGCGARSPNKTKPCNCVTNAAYRPRADDVHESTWWDEPPDPALAAAREEGRRAGLMEAAEIARNMKPILPVREGWITEAEALQRAVEAIEARADAKPTSSPDYLRGLEAAREIVRQYGLPSSMPGHEIVRNILEAISAKEAGDGA